MAFDAPPAARLAQNLLRDIEIQVSKFRRSQRYVFGSDLRSCAWQVVITANQAAMKPSQRAALVSELVEKVDELKLRLQLGHRLRLFSSREQFELLARMASQLGQQVGGWHKKLHPKGQNDRSVSADQRAMTLSTRAASKVEVNT